MTATTGHMHLSAPEARTRRQVAGATVGADMDALPLTALHLLVVAVAAFGFAFDMMEVALGNALSAVFSAPPYSVAPGQLSLLLSAMYIGAIPGALSAGWLADRFGRRSVLVAVLLVLAATSIAAAASRGIEELIAARMASGLALGAYPPLIIAFLTDLMPARRRGLLIMTVSGLAATGPMAMIFLVRWLTPIEPLGIEAWRWAFLVGSAGSHVVAVAFLVLPESPRWLSAKGRAADAEAALARFQRSRPIGAAGDPAPAGAPQRAEVTSFDWPRFGQLGLLYFAAPWATVAFPLLMGAVLIEKGFKLSDSLLYVGVSMAGPVVASLLAGVYLDRIERRAALIAFSAGMVLAVVAFAVTLEPLWLMAAGLVFQIMALLHVPTLTIYAAELFPTSHRGRTSAAAWSINRVASALAPLVLLPLMKSQGVWPMYLVMIAALLVGIGLAATAPNGRAGRSVD